MKARLERTVVSSFERHSQSVELPDGTSPRLPERLEREPLPDVANHLLDVDAANLCELTLREQAPLKR
jgi:hypothetical protein